MKFQEPKGVEYQGYTHHDCSDALPLEAVDKGMTLQSWTKGRRDPVCIHDSNGRILYQWPAEYVPSLTEVREVALSLITS